MKFSFILLTWNRYQFLERSLEALLKSIGNRDECEIVVMDNGSTDGTKAVLDRHRGEKNFRVITRERNYGLNAYKNLYAKARGKYIVVVDDDVLEFPENLDRVFAGYMEAFPDYGYLALNVVQNEFTNGAKPGPEAFTLDTRNGKSVERGPAGGWCACMRKKHYWMLWPFLMLTSLSMKGSEDGFFVRHLRDRLGLKAGIIRDAVCFHASGPHYAAQFGHLDREIEKYAASNLPDFVKAYESYRK
jgi:glycosyltransferase involved in cell wall biosynthesis